MIQIDDKKNDAFDIKPVDYSKIRELQHQELVADTTDYESVLGESEQLPSISEEVFVEDLVDTESTIPDVSTIIIEEEAPTLIPKVQQAPQEIVQEVVQEVKPVDIPEEIKIEDDIIEDDIFVPEPPMASVPAAIIEAIPPEADIADDDIEDDDFGSDSKTKNTTAPEDTSEPELKNDLNLVKPSTITEAQSIVRINPPDFDVDPKNKEFINRQDVFEIEGASHKVEIIHKHKNKVSSAIVFAISMLVTLVVLLSGLLIFVLFPGSSEQGDYISSVNIYLQALNGTVDSERLAVDSFVSGNSSLEGLNLKLNEVNKNKKQAYSNFLKLTRPDGDTSKQIFSSAESIFVASLNCTKELFEKVSNSASKADVLTTYNKYADTYNSNVYLYNTYVRTLKSNKSIFQIIGG